MRFRSSGRPRTERVRTGRRRQLAGVLAGLAAALWACVGAAPAGAVPGDLLGTVTLPGNGACSVTGTFDGTYYMTIQSSGCSSSSLGVYLPPAGGNGVATLVSTKSIVDGASNPVTISALAWDASRSRVWGAFGNQVWLIDVGDPTASGPAPATLAFTTSVGGITLVDGLEWDDGDDTLYHSPDVDCNVYQFSLGTGGNPPLGTLMNTVTPKSAGGIADCQVSGVEVGSANTLYVGRDGAAEIRRVDKTTGAFVSQFATTSGRVEDLTCDPVTYAPNEAILSKDAFNGLYEAFEVEAGTCPLPAPPEIQLDPPEAENEAGTTHTVTAIVTAGGQPIPGVLVSFTVVSGPNAGQSSDPGECSVNPACLTDAGGRVSWTYQSNGLLGTDVIQACFVDERTGERVCAEARKTWVDTTPPAVSCTPTTNPAGGTVPPAGQNPPSGQNPDGFYVLDAKDAIDPAPQIFVHDTQSSFVAGPFAPGTRIKLVEKNGAAPSVKPGTGVIDWKIGLKGDALVVAVDASGNAATTTCLVPPPPK